MPHTNERERLVLVTRFSDLRAGDLVVIKPCYKCDRTHRGLLMALDERELVNVLTGADMGIEPVWSFAPAVSHGYDTEAAFVGLLDEYGLNWNQIVEATTP